MSYENERKWEEFKAELTQARKEIEEREMARQTLLRRVGSITHTKPLTLDDVCATVEHLQHQFDALTAALTKARAERDEARTALDGWVKWASTSRCIYCGQEFTHDPHDQEAADEPKRAHILVCESHPLRQAKAENATLRAELQAAQAMVREWIAAVMEHHPVTWAMDPTSPRLMVGNIVRAAREQAHPTPAQEADRG